MKWLTMPIMSIYTNLYPNYIPEDQKERFDALRARMKELRENIEEVTEYQGAKTLWSVRTVPDDLAFHFCFQFGFGEEWSDEDMKHFIYDRARADYWYMYEKDYG